MPAGPNVSTLSIRVPRQLREIIAEACNETEESRAEFISANGAAGAAGVLKGKNMKLLPEWFELNKSDRRMMTITIDPDDLELTKKASGRMMIPHTRFILWAVVLVSIAQLGKKKVQQVSRRVAKEIRDEELAA